MTACTALCEPWFSRGGNLVRVARALVGTRLGGAAWNGDDEDADEVDDAHSQRRSEEVGVEAVVRDLSNLR